MSLTHEPSSEPQVHRTGKHNMTAQQFRDQQDAERACVPNNLLLFVY